MHSYFFIKKKWLLDSVDPTVYVNIDDVNVYIEENFDMYASCDLLGSIPINIGVCSFLSSIEVDLDQVQLLGAIPFGFGLEVINEEDINVDADITVILPTYPDTLSIINAAALSHAAVGLPAIYVLQQVTTFVDKHEFTFGEGFNLEQLDAGSVSFNNIQYIGDLDINIEVEVYELEQLLIEIHATIEADYSLPLTVTYTDLLQTYLSDLEIAHTINLSYNTSYIDLTEFSCQVVSDKHDVTTEVEIDFTTIRLFKDLYGLVVSDLSGLTFMQLNYNN